MPQSTLSTSRRQRASESESRAPFTSNVMCDPFNEDSTPFATYGAGAGSVPHNHAASPRGSPSPPAGRSPESAGLCGNVPSAMASFTRRLAAWVPSREANSASPNASSLPVDHKRSKSDGTSVATNSPPPQANIVPPLNLHSKGGAGEPSGRKAVTPRGTATATVQAGATLNKSPRPGSGVPSPRVGGPTSTTPRNHPPARLSSGLSSAPTVPLRRRTTPPPVIMAVPRGSANNSGTAGAGGVGASSSTTSSLPATTTTAAPLLTSSRQRPSEQHEPFVENHVTIHSAASAKTRLSGSPSSGATTSTITTPPAAAVAVVGRSSAGAESSAATTSPLAGKPPAFVGSHARATARLSASSSLHTTDRDGPSRSQSSSTPCWVTDTTTSTPESFEEEEHKSKEARRPFFTAAPAKGDYVPLIEWLLARGEQRDIGLPSATISLTSSNGITPRVQQSTFFNEDYIAKLCAAATQVLVQEPGLLHLNVAAEDTLVVVGDIHGQFQDLYTSVLCQQYDRRRCNPGGLDRHFLFMGDYVDRGPHSLEVVLLLLALKVEYPTLVYLTRGNHEEEKTSRVYGFLTEATSSLGAAAGQAVWSAVNKVFLDLPLAAIVKTPHMRFFVTHGGLSPCLHSVDEIAAVNRSRYSAGDITADQDDMVTGLLWSDPTTDVPMYRRNPRGCGFMFGPTASYNFCVENNVDFICRAHQVAMEGYIWTHNERVVTVFSAPNYCGVNGNKGAVLVVNGHTRRPILKQYESIEMEVEAPGPRPVFPYSSMFS